MVKLNDFFHMCCLPSPACFAQMTRTQIYKVINSISFLLFHLNTFQELKRERAKASLAIKSLRQKMEDKLKIELEQKVHI